MTSQLGQNQKSPSLPFVSTAGANSSPHGAGISSPQKPLGGDFPNFRLGRSLIRAQSGIPEISRELSDRLAGYFNRTLDQKEKFKLAARLMYPDCTEAAELQYQSLKKKLSPHKKMRLLAFAQFPDDPFSGRLIANSLSKGMSRDKHIKLYAARNYPNPTDILVRQSLQGAVQEFSTTIRQTDNTFQKQQALVEFVKTELRRGLRISTWGEIASLCGMDAKKVQELLEDKQHGLEKGLLAMRSERIFEQGEVFKAAPDIIALRAIEALVSIENQLHKAGKLKTLSYRTELAAVFGRTNNAMESLLKLINPEDTRYRERFFGNKTVLDNREEMRRYIAGATPASIVEIPDSEIAKRFKISPVVVDRAIHRAFSPMECENREQRLRQKKSHEEYHNSAVDYVRAELRAHKAGEIGALSTDSNIAARFGLQAFQVSDLLRLKEGGLPIGDRIYRSISLAMQANRDQFAEAIRKVTLHKAVDTIARALNRQIAPEKLPPKAAEQTASSDHRILTLSGSDRRHKCLWHNHIFDSAEEAACSEMFKKYIPGYRVIPGVTFQIDVGGHRMDFRVGNQIVEYHPTKLFYRVTLGNGAELYGDFRTQADYDRFRLLRDRLKNGARKQFIQETESQLEAEYKASRSGILRADPELANCQLVVARSPIELYYAVISVLGSSDEIGAFLPGVQQFLIEFRRTTMAIRAEQKRIPTNQLVQ